MRNKGAKVAILKLSLDKCEGTCITYSKIQYEYAKKLNDDKNIIKIRANIELEAFHDEKYPNRVYTSDFICTKKNGEIMVRECIDRKSINRPMMIRLLDESKKYWRDHGVSDWGSVVNAKTI